jgi:hypothetical protein
VLRHGLAFLHKRDAGSAVRHAVAIENGKVHQRFVENAATIAASVDMRKAPVTVKAKRREQDEAADSRKNLSHGSIPYDESFGCFGGTTALELIWNDFPSR